MFDPVPSYSQSDDDIKDLNAFISRVEYHAKLYKIDCSNRFSFILSACASLKDLLKQKGKDVWPKDSDEPITAFQDMFQLLIYGLGDKGLLFYDNGCWRGVIHAEPNDALLSVWANSERAYKGIAYALISQNESYLRLKTLRADLKSHVTRINNYENEISSENQNLDPSSNGCIMAISPQLNQILPALSKTDIDAVLTNLFSDHLFVQNAPLFLYYALSSKNPTQYNAATFLSDLNQHIGKPNLANQPQRRKEVREKCLLYRNIEGIVSSILRSFGVEQREFDAYRILFQLKKRFKLDFDIEMNVAIAKVGLSNYSHPQHQTSINIKINDTPIEEIMRAFFIIWKAKDFDFLHKGLHTPRSLRKSLRLLYQLNAVTPIEHIPMNTDGYSAQDYNDIKKRIFEEYPTMLFDNSQQMFWLVTGFIPPYDYSFGNYRTFMGEQYPSLNLYALCHQHLCHMSSILRSYGETISTSPSIPYETYIDILKARTFFSSKWNVDIEREFIDIFIDATNDPFRSEQNCENKLIDFVKEKYELFKNQNNNGIGKHSKVSYKSFQYADHEIYKALIYDCFSLTGIHIYQEVFSLLASLNRSLWPL